MSGDALSPPTSRLALAAAARCYRSGKAEEAYEICSKALEATPEDALLLALAGTLAGELGRTAAAIEQLGRAARLSPGRADILLNLAVALERAGELGPAIETYRRTVHAAPGLRDAWFGLARLLERTEQATDALAAYRRVLEIDPEHAGARHMAAALSGENPDAPPPGFVRALFDDYAGTFDSALVGQLAYRTPEMLREAVTALAPERRFRHVLDLGCGTGLAGAAFADVAQRLDGIDLSPAMIREAKRRGLYDDLRVGDAVEALADGSGWDLILAADVAVYLGDLRPLFVAVAGALARDGLFAFSVEHLAAGSYRLLQSGRYAHGEAYVEDLARQHGFSWLACRRGALRQNRGDPVNGRIHVLGRAAQNPCLRTADPSLPPKH